MGPVWRNAVVHSDRQRIVDLLLLLAIECQLRRGQVLLEVGCGHVRVTGQGVDCCQPAAAPKKSNVGRIVDLSVGRQRTGHSGDHCTNDNQQHPAQREPEAGGRAEA